MNANKKDGIEMKSGSSIFSEVLGESGESGDENDPDNKDRWIGTD